MTVVGCKMTLFGITYKIWSYSAHLITQTLEIFMQVKKGVWYIKVMKTGFEAHNKTHCSGEHMPHHQP